MSFISFTTSEFSIDKAIKSTTMEKIRNNLDWVKKAYQYNISDIPNRGFEIITNGVPDLWDCTTFPDGFVGVSSATQSEGQYSLMIVHSSGTGNGGEAVSDFIPVTTVHSPTIYYNHWGAGVDAGVLFNTYDSAFSLLATIGAYTTIRPPGTPVVVSTSIVLTAGAKWMKVKIKTNTAATVGGAIYYDDLHISTSL
jgi:hypothetical protein